MLNEGWQASGTKLSEGLKQIETGIRTLASGPMSFYIETMQGYAEALFSRFCPFQVGDRVRLTRTPEIGKEHGWAPYKHMLAAGALGTIESQDYRGGSFVFHVRFDRDTWIDRDGNEQPKLNPSLFLFRENYLEEENG